MTCKGFHPLLRLVLISSWYSLKPKCFQVWSVFFKTAFLVLLFYGVCMCVFCFYYFVESVLCVYVSRHAHTRVGLCGLVCTAHRGQIRVLTLLELEFHIWNMHLWAAWCGAGNQSPVLWEMSEWSYDRAVSLTAVFSGLITQILNLLLALTLFIV